MTLSANAYKVIFLRKKNGHAVGCVTINLKDIEPGLNRQSSSLPIWVWVRYQLSVQSPKDRFSRSIARQLAVGRLVENPIYVQVKFNSIHSLIEGVMSHIKNNLTLPKRARVSAALWLKTKVRKEAP